MKKCLADVADIGVKRIIILTPVQDADIMCTWHTNAVPLANYSLCTRSSSSSSSKHRDRDHRSRSSDKKDKRRRNFVFLFLLFCQQTCGGYL